MNKLVSSWLIVFCLIIGVTPVLAQSEIEPVEVTATTGPVYLLAGEVEYTLKFWNVGAQHQDSQYSRATLETQCLKAEGGWECTEINEIKEGIFSGGPNGSFSFGEAFFKLVDGRTAILSSQDFDLHFTVANPEAFAAWRVNDLNKEKKENPVLIKKTGGVNVTGMSVGNWLDWLWGRSVKPELVVGTEISTLDGQAMVKYPDGSQLIVLENSIFRFTNDGIYLNRGAIYLDVAEQDDDFLLQDSRANYVILGTKLFWDTDETKTIFDLMEGVVEIDRLGEIEDSVTLVTGESVIVTNQGFAEIQNFDIDQRLNEMKSIDEGIIEESDQPWPIGLTLVIVGVIVIIFAGYLWWGKARKR